MGNFKAQILGVILVLGIFGVLKEVVSPTFDSAWGGLYDKIAGEVTGMNPRANGKYPWETGYEPPA